MKTRAQKRTFSSKAIQGFSLVELMTVVAIIGILSAVAYPSYNAYMVKTKRSEATSAVLITAQFMERCKSTKFSYANCTLSALYTESEQKNFNIELKPAPTTSKYTIVATRKVNKTDPNCHKFLLTHLGVQSSLPGPGGVAEECWK